MSGKKTHTDLYEIRGKEIYHATTDGHQRKVGAVKIISQEEATLWLLTNGKC